ncbi:uncharacterized protein [Argopecten irradians]|uniref:uncharacterized protein n=1 Tax=Argopecten irradians TaxID=31199 RepID=UPI00371AE986
MADLWINYTTVAVPTTTEWAAWSEYESEYDRATRAGGVVGPIVGSVVVIIFVISVFCFTSHMRKRRQEMLAYEARCRNRQRQGDRTVLVDRWLGNTWQVPVGHSHSPDWTGEEENGGYVNRVMQDLPPPYSPPYQSELKDGDLPPSYADAVVMSGSDAERDNVTRSCNGNDNNYDDDYVTRSCDENVNNYDNDSVTTPYDEYDDNNDGDYDTRSYNESDVSYDVNYNTYDTDNTTEYSVGESTNNSDVNGMDPPPYDAHETGSGHHDNDVTTDHV